MNDSKTEMIPDFLNARYDEFMEGMGKVIAEYGEAMTPELQSKFDQGAADIEAKRKIVRRCRRVWLEHNDGGGSLSELAHAVDAGLILHDLATPYSDHPEYCWGAARGVEWTAR